ncbi:MAG: hypothetical protein M1831_000274 [Alyxoria varia]|nr:MAG: hypothetical protein M1831_000274 [Alyxoria varia]
MSGNGSTILREGDGQSEAQTIKNAQSLNDDENHERKAHNASASNTPNDSEAETEILADSRRQTPRKKEAIKRENSAEVPQTKPVNATRDRPADSIERPDSPQRPRKRKAEERDGQNGGAASDGQGSGDDKRETMVKKARLSSNSESESDAKPPGPASRRSRPPLHERKAESELNLRSIKSSRDHLPALDFSPTRASTHSPLSQPKSPTLRSTRHTRATSFHSTALQHDRGTRLRKKLLTREENWDPDLQAHNMPRPKDVDQSGRTPLARAAYDGNLEKVRSILNASTEKLDQPDYAQNTPLQMAACNGHATVVKELISWGANVNNVNGDQDTPLKDAEDNGHEDVIVLLKAKGAQHNVKEDVTQSLPRHRHHYQQPSAGLLLQYIKDGDAEGVGRTLEVISIEPSTEHVVAGVRCGNTFILEMLLAYGGKPDPQTETDGVYTPLMAAVDSGNVPALKLLLKQQANPNRLVFGGKHNLRQYAAMKRPTSWHSINQAIDTFTQFREPSQRDYRDTTTASASKPETHTHTSQSLSTVQEASEGTGEGTQVTEHSVDPQQQQVERQNYLAKLPRGLRKALEEGTHLPITSTAGTDTGHLKCVKDFSNLVNLRLCEIGDDVPPEHTNQLWVLGFYGSVLLGHSRLDTIRSLVSTTRPISKDLRKTLWTKFGLGNILAFPSEYDRAKDEIAVHKADGIPINVTDASRQLFSASYSAGHHYGLHKWLNLDDEQVFWVKLDDLLALTKPGKCPRLKDLILRVPMTYHVNTTAFLNANGLGSTPQAEKNAALMAQKILRFKNGAAI